MSKEQIDELKRQDLKHYLEKNGHEFEKNFTLCPFHADGNASMSVKDNLWYCHSCQVGGTIIDYVIKKDNVDTKTAIESLVAEFDLKEKERKEVARYEYTDEHGQTLYHIIRYEPKNFIADRKMDGVPRVPYHFGDVCEAEQVWLVEGEKDADALMEIGLVGTTMPFGVKNWKKEHASYFKDIAVFVCLDKGRVEESNQRAIDLLNAGAKSVKILDLDGLEPEQDVSDWLKTHTKEDLLDVVANTSQFSIDKAELVEDLGMAELVREYVEEAVGWFKINEIYNYIGIRDRNDKKNVSKALSRLAADDVLYRHPRSNGLYRKVDRNRDVMHWREAQICPMDIKLPFGISEFMSVYPKNILVVAGSPDAGKTACFLEFIKNNMEFLDIHYFNSEMSDEELKLRLQAHKDILESQWNFEAVSRVAQFADVIEPNAVNVIDYMELGDEIYKVGLFMRELHDRLESGVAIVGIQKPYGREMGYGKELALQIPRLYVSLEYHKRHSLSSARILKCKNKKTTYSMIGAIKYYKIFEDGSKIQDHGLWHNYGDDPMDKVIFEERKKAYS